MPVTSNSLAALLERDETLAPLLCKLDLLATLQRALTPELPRELTRSCKVANIKRGVVLLEVPGNAAAAKVKQIVPRLLARLQLVSGDVNSIRVSVQFPDGTEPRPARTAKPLGASPVKQLEQLAQSLPDSPLREAIRSLATKGPR